MRVEETPQERKNRAFRLNLVLAFICILFILLITRTYNLQITNGEKARLKSETYEDVIVKKSIFNDQYYSSQNNTPLQKDINPKREK